MNEASPTTFSIHEYYTGHRNELSFGHNYAYKYPREGCLLACQNDYLEGKMEALLPIIIQLIGGGAGGNVIGKIASGMSMGSKGNTIVGALGGLAGTFLAGKIPGLDALVGMAAPAADAVAGGGLDIGALVGQGASGLVGGGILTAIVGLIKNNMMKS